jgi:hypothetical protein
MAVGRSPSIVNGAAAAGHGLALLGFALPWVVGQFGVRQQLSGLDLARLAGDAITEGLAGATLALSISRIVLLIIPLAAANALALLAASHVGVLSHRTVHRAAVLLALPVVAIALTGLTLVLLSLGDGVISAPGYGLLAVIAGGTLAIASVFFARPTPDR